MCGGLAAGAFAPWDLWPLALLAPLGLLHLLAGRSTRQGLWLGLSFGLGMNLPGLEWIHVSMTQFGGLSLPVALLLVALLGAYLALYPALACALLNRFFPRAGAARNLLAFPALWLRITSYNVCYTKLLRIHQVFHIVENQQQMPVPQMLKQGIFWCAAGVNMRDVERVEYKKRLSRAQARAG